MPPNRLRDGLAAIDGTGNMSNIDQPCLVSTVRRAGMADRLGFSRSLSEVSFLSAESGEAR